MSRRRIIVIGAGPAGLMAAQRAAEAGADVTVHERMPSPARKFLMAGRGGLNLTHSEPTETFLTRYGPAAETLRPFIEAFTPDDLRAWAHRLGEETFTGSSGRVFPKSFKASPLLRRWLEALGGLGVRLERSSTWRGWRDGELVFSGPDGAERTVAADATILALGGASWPRLGSDGSWRSLLEERGVTVTPLVAANNGVLITWSAYLADRFAGTPLKRIALTGGGVTQRGEAMVTRTGLEGGAVYALGAALRATGAGSMTLDLRPDETAEALAARLSRPRGKASLSTFLHRSLNLPAVAIALLHEAAGKVLPSDPAQLAALIKAVPLKIEGFAGPERAISTAGGIAFDEVSPTLELKRLPGVWVCGEMLDWEAPTGGYLLQACFATGAAAGLAAAA